MGQATPIRPHGPRRRPEDGAEAPSSACFGFGNRTLVHRGDLSMEAQAELARSWERLGVVSLATDVHLSLVRLGFLMYHSALTSA